MVKQQVMMFISKALLISSLLLSSPSSICLSRAASFVVSPNQNLHHRRHDSKSAFFPTKTTLSAKKTAKKRLDKNKNYNNNNKSKVQDPDGPTPQIQQDEIEVIDVQDIPELQDISDPSQLPAANSYQPWRRGDMAGCDAPIAAPWRQEAVDIINKAVTLVGGRVLDVTWYLTQVVVTIDETIMPSEDYWKASGPQIDIIDPPGTPLYKDPADPEPEDIWDDEDDVLFQHETEQEAEEAKLRKENMYAPKELDDQDDDDEAANASDDLPSFLNQETREDVALKVTIDQQERFEEEEKQLNIETIKIDSAALSTIAKAILDALEEREEELQVLSRHELILTSPGASDVIETQRQFDAYRGFEVIVETQDPFESNRTLRGKLVERNSMDLIINKKGRMVTIPLNFVKCVRLPPAKREKGVPRDAPF